jgi:hypothetical protein
MLALIPFRPCDLVSGYNTSLILAHLLSDLAYTSGSTIELCTIADVKLGFDFPDNGWLRRNLTFNPHVGWFLLHSYILKDQYLVAKVVYELVEDESYAVIDSRPVQLYKSEQNTPQNAVAVLGRLGGPNNEWDDVIGKFQFRIGDPDYTNMNVPITVTVSYDGQSNNEIIEKKQNDSWQQTPVFQKDFGELHVNIWLQITEMISPPHPVRYLATTYFLARLSSSPPGPPQQLSAFAKFSYVWLVWNPPSNIDGSALQSYRIYRGARAPEVPTNSWV